MANPKAAWGMELGACAIKAIRLERDGDTVRITDFAVVPHKKVLSTPDVDQDELVRLSLGQFISQKSLEGEHLVMSVPGHAAFARFAKLPPVDPKKVPDIVKFEAVQQIPFPIEQVEWDYQTFTSADSPDIEVGIFAITRERVQQRLGLYAELGITPEALTLSPVAVYNAATFDQSLTSGGKGPVILLDIGTSATDVVIADGGRCWIRTFPLGGTHFTEAIANSFKLSYSKAEKLKCEAATSKYTKPIMQAMRPVFSDLLQDLQRSIGYYQSLHRDSELKTIYGLGSTFKIPGLRKFIGQQLQVEVFRLDEYKRIQVTGREAAAFAENAVNMATAYGLALQGVGLAPISVNLVPVHTLRDEVWHSKTKWFAAAAAVVVIGSGMLLARPIMDQSDLDPAGAPPAVAKAISVGNDYKRQFEDLQNRSNVGFRAENLRRLVDHRGVWPYIVHDVADALATTSPQPELLSADPTEILGVDPKERRLVQLMHMDGRYMFVGDKKARRIAVTMNVELSHDKPREFLNETVARWLRDNAVRPEVPYRIITDTVTINPDQLSTFEVTETGESAQTGRPSDAGAPGSPGAPTAPASPETPGGIGQPTGGGPGFGTGGGGDNPYRKNVPGGPKRKAPGFSGAGGGSMGGGPGGSSPGLSRPREILGDDGLAEPAGGAAGAGTAGGREGLQVNLDSDAPLPARPAIYSPGTRYYRIPITFEVELIEVGAPAPAAQSARAGASGGEEPS